MKVTFIYALIDPRTDEIRYIGKTVNPNARFRQHLKNRRCSTHCTTWIDSLITEGLKPTMTILESVSDSNGSEQERWWIAEGKRIGLRLTNLTDGGEGITMTPERRKHLSDLFTGRKVSEEQKAQISATLRGHITTEETKSKISASKVGKPGKSYAHTDEAREKMSAAHTGKKRAPHSEATKEKMRQAALGKKHGSPSQETRAKLSAANKGKPLTEEHRQKISAAKTGQGFTDEHRQHLSEAHQGKSNGSHTEATKAKISAAHQARRQKAPSNPIEGEEQNS